VRNRIDRSGFQPSDHAEKTSDHLARLWAFDEIGRLISAGKKEARNEAMELALQYRLVTPFTGAVVLETDRDYQRAGLKPPAPKTVPSIPEPETWALMFIALCALGWLVTRRRELWARN